MGVKAFVLTKSVFYIGLAKIMVSFCLAADGRFSYRQKKKESRLTPTFVNLKSNTMKNTLQRYALFLAFASFVCENACFIT